MCTQKHLHKRVYTLSPSSVPEASGCDRVGVKDNGMEIAHRLPNAVTVRKPINSFLLMSRVPALVLWFAIDLPLRLFQRGI